MLITTESILHNIKEQFEANSDLSFTFEKEMKNSISFLDVNITRSLNTIKRSVYVKSTSSGDCINYIGLAPDKYKVGTIKTLLHRAFKVCSDWKLFHLETNRLKQLFTNNNFPMRVIEDEVNRFLDMKLVDPINHSDKNVTQIYYQGCMHTHYKQEERNLNKIIHENISPAEGLAIKLSIYYKTKKLSNMFIKNNINRDTTKSSAVYRYTCSNVERCQPQQFYIGFTTTSFRQRASTHAQTGAIQLHNLNEHGIKITTNDILENMKTLFHSHEKSELLLAEALFIKSENPPLNRQHEGDTRILKIF